MISFKENNICKILGIKYPPSDVDPILSTILKGKEEQRIHAIEFLDNILDSELKKELMPVAESILVEITSQETVKKLNLKVFSENECFMELLNRKDAKLKLAVLSLIEKTKDKKFNGILEHVLSNESNEKIRLKAQQILNLFSTLP